MSPDIICDHALSQASYGHTVPDLDGPEPFYEQIAAILTDRIAEGTYPLRGRIPAEYDLMLEFGVSRPTVRRAVAQLVDRGLLRTSRGKGTYVIARTPTS